MRALFEEQGKGIGVQEGWEDSRGTRGAPGLHVYGSREVREDAGDVGGEGEGDEGSDWMRDAGEGEWIMASIDIERWRS